jgi:hypothetical protein
MHVPLGTEAVAAAAVAAAVADPPSAVAVYVCAGIAYIPSVQGLSGELCPALQELGLRVK